MKKILILIALIIFCDLNNVKAEQFYEKEWISGIYATYKSDDLTKSQLMRFIRRQSDDKFTYCLTPSALLYDDSIYTVNNNPTSALNISQDKLRRIELISYYGYGYLNHTANKWYAITQYMLWREVDNADIYWTDKFKGERITRFETEIKEIENLVNNHNTVPSISDLNLVINKTYTIIDKKSVLNNYDIVYSNELEVIKNSNTLTIKPIKKGEYKIKFIKKDKIYNNTPILYTTNKGQDVYIVGGFNDVSKDINIKVNTGSLSITKIDSETLENKAISGTLEGAKYDLFLDNKLITTLTTNTEAKAYIDNLSYGNYVLKEKEASMGYLIDNNSYSFSIDDNSLNISLSLKEEAIKKRVLLNKYAYEEKSNSLLKEDNISFSIYDLNNNLIKKAVTNKDGFIDFTLLYGDYILKQDNSWLNYIKMDDKKISVSNNEDLNLDIFNNKFKTKIKVINKDSETMDYIKNEASFKIFDVEINKYIEMNNSTIFKTDINGSFVTPFPLEAGSYILEEVSNPNGYYGLIKKKFVIDEFINTYSIDNDLLFDIDVLNDPIKGQIKINTQGFINDKYINMDNVYFELYANNDIVFNDKLFYKKDDLIETLVTKDGFVLSKILQPGNYYLKEVKTNDGFILDDKVYFIDLNDKNSNYILKELNIINYSIPLKEDIVEIINKTPIIFNNESSNKMPITSNIQRYRLVLISYLLFLSFIILLMFLKYEK